MSVEIIKDKTNKDKIKELAEGSFGSMFKVAVDVERKMLAAGGEFHADGEQLLLQDGSKQKDIWGANYYPFEKPHNRIEYSALINIRPNSGNRSMKIESPEIREKIKTIIGSLLLGENDAIS
jgi:hypothetical protein